MKAANDNGRPVGGMACVQDDFPDFTHLVYVVRCERLIKIGYSSCMWRRVAEIRREVLESIEVLASFLGGSDLEAALHRHFVDYDVGIGEWFEVSGAVKDWVDAGCPDDLPRGLVARRAA